ncbi:MAG: hypothetical protein H8D78_17305 [Chloroflexi bacterium]|nr:hypothetical protein [Chloroflexota bacterium]
MSDKSIPESGLGAVDAERRQNLREQLAIQRRNLNDLELQRARYGIRVPLDLVNEIRLVQEHIGEIEQELAQLDAGEPGQPAEPGRSERAQRLRMDSGGGTIVFGDVHVGGDFIGRDRRTVIGGQEDADDE